MADEKEQEDTRTRVRKNHGRTVRANHPENKRTLENRKARGQNESSDLNEREYREEQGNIHHHTHTAKEQQK
jgi:hypothetical protein